ncbi:MAG: BACON domain-containing protein [Vicinamibacterales bacterium]
MPSADHGAVVGGVAVVTSYQLRIFGAGTTQVVRSVDLGKPTPEGDGFIRIDYVSRLSTPLAPGQSYEARVAAIGPGGVAVSGVSNPFSFTPPCTPTLSSTSVTLPAAAASRSVTVTAAAGCTWSASSPVSWITITSASSGTGTGNVTFSASANTAASTRAATLTIAGLAFRVTQSAATSCTYTISPSSRTSIATGGTFTVAVSTGSSCRWSAAANVSWLTLGNGSNRIGPGNVGVIVAANTATSQRTGTATIAGRAFTVTQAGVSCSATVSPRTISAAPSGRTGTISVTAGTSCSWSVTGLPSWITVSAGARRGTANVSYTVAQNTGASRRATLTVAGRSVTISQSAGTPPRAPSGVRIVTSRGGAL